MSVDSGFVQTDQGQLMAHVTTESGKRVLSFRVPVKKVDLSSTLSAMVTQRDPAYLSRDYERLWDLVRQMREQLLDADLITTQEYTALLAEETEVTRKIGSPSPRRLESYDEMRARIEALLKGN